MIDLGQVEGSLHGNYFDRMNVRDRFCHLLLYSYDLGGRDFVVGNAVEGVDG
jgi:hypothetical protein